MLYIRLAQGATKLPDVKNSGPKKIAAAPRHVVNISRLACKASRSIISIKVPHFVCSAYLVSGPYQFS